MSKIKSLNTERVTFLDNKKAVTQMNTKLGREFIEKNIPEPYKSAIFVVWGDNPTIDGNDVD